MKPEPMVPCDEPQVRRLYEVCHPGWKTLPRHWFYAHPTLVIIDRNGVVAYTSYSMNVSDDGVHAIYLRDTCVAPHMRGRGLSRVLMNARLEIGRSLGATLAVGMTQPDNVQMLNLLRSMGFREVAQLPGVYTEAHPPLDGIAFTLDISSTALASMEIV